MKTIASLAFTFFIAAVVASTIELPVIADLSYDSTLRAAKRQAYRLDFGAKNNLLIGFSLTVLPANIKVTKATLHFGKPKRVKLPRSRSLGRYVKVRVNSLP